MSLSEAVSKAYYEPASKAKFILKIAGCDVETSVISFGAQEEMSSPYLVNLLLACHRKIPFDMVLGKDALLSIVTTGKPRYFHGIVAKFRRSGRQGEYYLYQTHMVPYLALLDLSSDCRIFQNMTVVDIVKDIFEKHHISSDRYKFLSLKNEHLQRGYCVQYRETDLNFISRILAEEGIFYYFEHLPDKHIMVFGDNSMNYMKIPGETTVTFKGASGMNPEAENIFGFDVSRTLTPSKVTHRDFNYEKTPLELKGHANGESDLLFEVYDYPGSFQDPEKGKQLADIHLEALNTFNEKGEGESICPRLAAGFTFSMDKGKPVQYLAVSVAHGGFQPQVLGEQAGQSAGPPYTNDFLAIPATVTYRPRIFPKPVITGLQTATVVGPKGEEIYTDDYGRIKVHFHWDRLGNRDDKSSCWIRVAQSWGGGARGTQYIPRIGDEVLVDFLEGDPDRPIITGSVYNSDNMPINSLKQSITQSGFKTKTHKGDGYHELRFDDAKGAEEIYLRSEKDWNIVIKERKGLTVGGDSSTVITKNSEQSVGGDSYSYVTGTQTEIGREIIISASDKITLICGASSIVITPGDIKLNGPKIYANDGSKAAAPPTRPVAGATKDGGGGNT
jgi:type VI secretion system secreted protein VgrG